jgi:hypothetical protein
VLGGGAGRRGGGRHPRSAAVAVTIPIPRMKTWKILRDCRLSGDGVHRAMLGIARMHNLALAG